MKKLLIVLALLVTAACGPWLRVEGPFTSEALNFRVDLPQGWMQQNTGKYLLITRDGVLLQRIVAMRINLADEKQFTHTKKRVTAEMLPQEVAEVVIDNFQSNAENLNFEVEENAPAAVAGKHGFKVRFSYRTKEGLKYRCVYYGVLAGDSLYEIFYLAPQRYYYDKDLKTFEDAVPSFRLVKS